MNAILPQTPYVLDGLLWRAEHLVLPWMAERIEGMQGLSFGPATAIGILGRDRETGEAKLFGGVAYSHWFDHQEGGDCEVSTVFVPGARITRRMWRHLYGYPFVTMRCRRMSAHILKKNRPARTLATRSGFVEEGCKRQAQGRQDLIVYGLLKAECKFL